jgi:hypothetical protein
VTHCRTALLVIARSGTSPKRGRTCFAMVVSSRARVVARRSCRVGSHCSTHSDRRMSPRRGSRQIPPANATSISALRRSASTNLILGSRCDACPSHRGNAPCSAQRFGLVRTGRAAEGDAAQCAPRYLWPSGIELDDRFCSLPGPHRGAATERWPCGPRRGPTSRQHNSAGTRAHVWASKVADPGRAKAAPAGVGASLARP